MPPKKKKGPVIIDGVDTTPMSREKLEAFALRLKEQNEREREERNYFQLDRDKIRTFWEITRNELDEARAKLRNKDRQIEEATEKNEEELKFYKQKVKHLQFEHQNDLTDCKEQSLASLKMAQDDHTAQERELLRDKRDLKSQLRDQELSHQEQIKNLKLQHSEEISNIRNAFQEKEKELENKYEKKYADLKQELNTIHDMQMAEMEERKNNQITALTKHHDQAFFEMKNYYNDITLNNLALINTLKAQMEDLRKQNERMTKLVADVTAENRRLLDPLKKAQADVLEYKRQLQNYEKDKICLANTKLKLEATAKELENLRWAYDALELRFEKLTAEKNLLSSRFVDAVLEVQQKTGMKNVLLQQRVYKLTEKTEFQTSVIAELSTFLNDEQVAKVNTELEKLLDAKNTLIHDLQYELARVSKAHDDLLETYEDKLQHYGVSKVELGFVPLRIIPEGQGGMSKTPAGLVTKNR